jgi:hypothetical protein
MMLSSILDIGSFFIGMIINLLLVTLMCYYFKKKYESLEEAQNEQAKLLYDLLRDRKQSTQETPIKSEVIEIEDSDDESDESEGEMEELVEPENKVLTLDIPETNDTFTVEKFSVDKFTVDMVDTVTVENPEEMVESEPDLILEENDGFSKMNMKQLRDLVTKKGVKVKPSMKKNELVELAKL